MKMEVCEWSVCVHVCMDNIYPGFLNMHILNQTMSVIIIDHHDP